MTQDLPARHLRLVLDDDLRLEAASEREYRAWRAALGSAPEEPAPRVLIAAHGGLISRAAGEIFAGHVRELYAEYWTVTFITRTGLEEALDRMTNTHLFSGLVAAVSRLAALYRRADPGAFFPGEWAAREAVTPARSPTLNRRTRTQEGRILAHLGTLARPEFAGESAEVQALVRGWQANPGELSAAVRSAARQAGARLGARTWQSVRPQVERLLPRPPGPRVSLTPPELQAALANAAAAAADPNAWQAYVVEELIRTVFPPPRTLWEGMKDRMAALLGPGAVGTGLLEFLNGRSPHVSLLGHSLGGILLDHLARRAVALSPLRERVARAVYLTPANTLDFARQTPRLPRAEYALMGLTDAEERNEVGQIDPLLSGLYPRTVLYLVSNALEDERGTPILGMQRFLPGDPFHRRFRTVTWVPTPQLPQFTHHGFLETPAVRAWVRERLGVG